MLKINRVYHGDCLEVMKDIDDKSIDLIISDPPYNIGKDKWDKIDNYLEFMQSVFLQCQRILKDNGSFYWFHNQMPIIARLMLWLESTEFVFKQLIVWNKRFEKHWNQLNAIVGSNEIRNYSKQAEYILFYTFQDETGLATIKFDSKLWLNFKQYFLDEFKKANLTIKKANQIMGLSTNGGNLAAKVFGKNQDFELLTKERYKSLQTTGYFQKPYESLRQEYESLRQEYESLRYTFNNQKTHHSIWNYEIPDKCGHLTPKPIELIENIIKHSSNEGDLVLDNCAGSGTTGIAARNLNRNFILIEKELEYVELIEKRLSEPMQTKLT